MRSICQLTADHTYHLYMDFADAPFYGNGTSEHLFDIGLCLPSGPTLTDEDIRRVVDSIVK